MRLLDRACLLAGRSLVEPLMPRGSAKGRTSVTGADPVDRRVVTPNQTSIRFQAPAGWDVPDDASWVPPKGRAPQPWWPPAPAGWQYWVQAAGVQAAAPTPVSAPGAGRVSGAHPAKPAAPTAPSPKVRQPVIARVPRTDLAVEAPVEFWSLKMPAKQVAKVVAILLVLGAVFVTVRVQAARQDRADSLEQVGGVCEQAVQEQVGSCYMTFGYDEVTDVRHRTRVCSAPSDKTRGQNVSVSRVPECDFRTLMSAWHHIQRLVATPSLDTAHIGSVHADVMSKRALRRPSPFLSEVAEVPRTESNEHPIAR